MALSYDGAFYTENPWVGGAIAEEIKDLARHITTLINRCNALEWEKEELLRRVAALEKRVELPIFTIE